MHERKGRSKSLEQSFKSKFNLTVPVLVYLIVMEINFSGAHSTCFEVFKVLILHNFPHISILVRPVTS